MLSNEIAKTEDEEDFDDFTKSTSTRTYLETEKSVADTSLDFLSEPGEEDNAYKRQSTVGTYLFGQDVKNLDMESTISIIESTVAKDADLVPAAPTKSTMVRNFEDAEKKLKSKEEHDERMVKTLSEHENGFGLLLNRAKESIQSAKDAAAFLKKRAAIEQDYAASMLKLGALYMNDQQKEAKSKDGTYKDNFKQFAKMHLDIGELRLNFATSIGELAQNTALLARNTERSRKQLKDLSNKHLRDLNDSEMILDAARFKVEHATEALERFQGSSNRRSRSKFPKMIANSFNSSYQMLKNRIQDMAITPKTEEEARQRVSAALDAYKQQLHQANADKQTYHKVLLPESVAGLKEAIVNCDDGLKKFLCKYASCVESLIMVEATMISPLESSNENNEGDFETYITSGNLGQVKSVEPFEEYTPEVPKTVQTQRSAIDLAQVKLNPVKEEIVSTEPVRFKYFGSDLVSMMKLAPDQDLIPEIVTNCVEYIEATALKEEGLYRVSGSSSQIQQIKQCLDKNPRYPLEDIVTDVHAVTGCLKLFFRELSDSLFPHHQYPQFMEAVKNADPRLRLIQIHEQVNLFHDANYATLKYLLHHLQRVCKYEKFNKMNEYSLGTVWGPTLVQAGPNTANDLKYHNTVVEILITNVEQIFDMDN